MISLWSILIPIIVFCCQDTPTSLPVTFYEQYPVMRNGLGEAGSSSTDLTMYPPQIVFISFSFDKESIWVSSNISPFILENPDIPLMIRLDLNEDGRYIYQQGERNEQGSIWISLKIDNRLLQGSDHLEYVMGYSESTFILAPLNSPDPRNTSGQRCENGAQIRLKIGARAGIHSMSGIVDLFEEVDTWSSISVNAYAVDVVAGPLCVRNVAWWQVQLQDDTDSVAWLPEMTEKGTYLTTPIQVDADEPPMECSSTLPSRLSLGAYVSLIPASIPMYWRADISSGVKTHISGDAIYRIVSAPICANGTSWWEIENVEIRGWVIESDREGYHIQPSPHIELSSQLQESKSQG